VPCGKRGRNLGHALQRSKEPSGCERRVVQGRYEFLFRGNKALAAEPKNVPRCISDLVFKFCHHECNVSGICVFVINARLVSARFFAS
jgi:hypothetical protein